MCYLAYVLFGRCATWPIMRIICIVHRGKMWKNVQRNPTKRHLLSSEIRTPSRPRRFGPSKRSPLLEMHHGWRENSHPCPQYSENGTNRLRRTNAVQTQKTHKSRTITAFAWGSVGAGLSTSLWRRKKTTRVGPPQRLVDEVSERGCPHRWGDGRRPERSVHHSV